MPTSTGATGATGVAGSAINAAPDPPKPVKSCYLKFRADIYTDGRGGWFIRVDGVFEKMPTPDMSKIEAAGFMEVTT